MNFWLHPEAERDLELISERYKRSFGQGSVQRFIAEYERVRSVVLKDPEIGTKLSRGRRMYPLKAVPYLIVYRVEENGLVILIVRHQHRSPRLGSRRN